MRNTGVCAGARVALATGRTESSVAPARERHGLLRRERACELAWLAARIRTPTRAISHPIPCRFARLVVGRRAISHALPGDADQAVAVGRGGEHREPEGRGDTGYCVERAAYTVGADRHSNVEPRGGKMTQNSTDTCLTEVGSTGEMRLVSGPHARLDAGVLCDRGQHETFRFPEVRWSMVENFLDQLVGHSVITVPARTATIGQP